MVLSASLIASSCSSTRPTFQSMFSHIARTQGVGAGFPFRPLAAHRDRSVLVPIPIFVRHTERRMRGIERQVTKEGTIGVFIDERDRMIGQIVGDISLAAHQCAVVFQRRVEYSPQ